MNVTDKIKFDNELIGNKSSNITYNGYLCEIESSEVSIVYGFDDDWKNTTEKAMTKTEDGFSASIPICNYSKIVFCFKNNDGIYDNNFNQNFSVPIKMRQKNKRFIINENYLLQIYHELRRDDMSKIIEEETKEEKESIKIANASVEELPIENVPSSDFDMNSFVDSLISPIAEEKGVDKQDVYDFDVETLTEKYVSNVSHENVVNTNDIVFNKIEIQTPEEDDISEKKVLLSQINDLFDELVREEENENVNKLYELSTGSTLEEDKKEVSRMIDETEKAMNDINKLFLDIDYINSTKTDSTPVESINEEESTVQKAVPLNVENIVSATEVSEENKESKSVSEEESSLFNEYENTDTSNKNVVPSSYEDEISKLESEASTSDEQKISEEDPGKYLLVQNNDSLVDKIKMPFTKLFKLIGLGLSKLFNKED